MNQNTSLANPNYTNFQIDQCGSLPLADNAIYPLANNAFISVKGPDAKTFLQGQLSCDLNTITQSQASLGSHSDAKGRMQSSFRICQVAEDEYWLKVHNSIAEHALASLKKFSIFSKVTLSILDDIIGIGLHGESAIAALNTMSKLDSSLNLQQYEQCTYLNTSTNHAYEIFGPIEKITSLWRMLNEKVTSYSPSQLLLLEHNNGLAFIQESTIGEFVAQQFNYQSVGAISFTKGCYTGQEIIARMQYRGKLKRTMQHWIITTEGAINIGSTVSLEGQSKTIGHILSVVNTSANQWDILINIEQQHDNGTQYILDKSHAFNKTAMIDLPYSLDI